MYSEEELMGARRIQVNTWPKTQTISWVASGLARCNQKSPQVLLCHFSSLVRHPSSSYLPVLAAAKRSVAGAHVQLAGGEAASAPRPAAHRPDGGAPGDGHPHEPDHPGPQAGVLPLHRVQRVEGGTFFGH